MRYWFLLLLPITANAEMVIFDWDHPTQKTDNSPLPIAEIQETRLYCDGDTTATFVVPAPAPTTSENMTLGAHSCHATTVDTSGGEGLLSNVVNFTVSRALPGAPVLRVNL